MAIPVVEGSGVKIYNLSNDINGTSAETGIPAWLAKQNDKKLKKDSAWRNRIELIQDFEFPEASLKLKKSRDGKHIMATGVYKPQIRVFELAEMSMKFERHTECDNVQFLLLSDDWTKSVHLQSDRSIEFHSQSGMHYRTRIPRFGRDLAYHYPSCDLLIVGASSEVYRLNLQQGQFLNSLQTQMPSINAAAVNPLNELWTFGGENGIVEFWDHRSRSCTRTLNVAQAIVQHPLFMPDESNCNIQVTKLVHGYDGLSLAVGTSTGQVLLFDLRSNKPRIIKDHMYGAPIVGIDFYVGQGVTGEAKIVSADRKSVKIWSKNTGEAFAAIEPAAEINDLLLYAPDSGMIMLANEGVSMQTYFIPEMGAAPRWCHFLDSITEEMEEAKAPVVYDDYKFVTKSELDSLALSHLIGTPMLRAYMHGYFIDLRLYDKARAIANPFAFQEYKEKKALEKLEKERGSRIGLVSKLPKVNRRLAAQLLAKVNAKVKNTSDIASDDAADDDEHKATVKRVEVLQAQSSATASLNPTGDSRFAQLFEDADYAIDEKTEEFKLKYPTMSTLAAANELDESSSSSDEEKEIRTALQSQHPLLANDPSAADGSDDSESSSNEEHESKEQVKEKPPPQQRVSLADATAILTNKRTAPVKFEAFSSSDPIALNALRNPSEYRGARGKQTLGDKLKTAQSKTGENLPKRSFKATRASGNLTFTVSKPAASKEKPKTLGEQAEYRAAERARLEKKRSIKQLRLKRVA